MVYYIFNKHSYIIERNRYGYSAKTRAGNQTDNRYNADVSIGIWFTRNYDSPCPRYR